MKDFFRKFRLILMAVFILLVVVIVLQNTESVETKLLFVKLEMPRAVLLFGTLLVGFALGVIVSTLRLSGRPRK